MVAVKLKKLSETDKLRVDFRVANRHLVYVAREFLKGAADRAALAFAVKAVDEAEQRLAKKLPFGSPR